VQCLITAAKHHVYYSVLKSKELLKMGKHIAFWADSSVVHF
jgi:hypothetical protein